MTSSIVVIQAFATAFIVLAFLPPPTLSGKNQHDEGVGSAAQNGQQGHISIETIGKKSLSTGKDTQFKCSAFNQTSVYWRNMNGSVIQQLNDTRFSEADGWLNISSLQVADTGDYTCLTTDDAHNATVYLNVYEMPDYFLESMIVIALNVALALLFFSCLIYKTIQGRRESNKYKKYKEANIDITVNSDGKPKAHNKHLDI